MGLLRLTALLAAILLATRADAAEYFVAPTGSDQNDGSEGRPFATLAHARLQFIANIRADIYEVVCFSRVGSKIE